MRKTVDIGWLHRAICLCRGSAVAYKAAFMLASDPCKERHLLKLCTARYALLERLLAELDVSVGPAHLRRLLECGGDDDVQPASLEVALTAAVFCDCGLTQMFGPDLALPGDSSIASVAAGTHTPLHPRVADARLLPASVYHRGEADPRHRATSP